VPSSLAALTGRRRRSSSSSNSSSAHKGLSPTPVNTGRTLLVSPNAPNDRAGHFWDWLTATLVPPSPNPNAPIDDAKVSVTAVQHNKLASELEGSSNGRTGGDSDTNVADRSGGSLQPDDAAVPLSRQASDATIVDGDEGAQMHQVLVVALGRISVDPQVQSKLGKARAWMCAMLNCGGLASALNVLTTSGRGDTRAG
jgi:hypothetical protein